MKVQLTCDTCGITFEREAKEVNRNRKNGRRTYCSFRCNGKANNEHLPKGAHNENLKRSVNDEFSPFRLHMRNCKKSGKPVEITLADLKDQWDSQKGICPYTGWKMKIMGNTNHKSQLPRTHDRASLDRKNSLRGYTKDNIQFVSMMAQFAKNSFDDDVLLGFCKSVVEHKGL